MSTDLGELYARYAPVVYRRSLAMLADRDEALDAVQDIFLLLRRELASFRGEASMMTWIYRITTNHCLNRLRARRRRRGTLEGLARCTNESDGGVAARRTERRQLLQRLLAALDERRVQITIHYYYDEMTQPEIAALLGISDRAVRKALRRVEQKARALGGDLATLEEA